ncbi:MAG TPA: hypothetical protein VMZ91_12760 [Candidatus Paceibacterota bacterium]|nr:hypothetical protein [Candidatus Paceibacterota bacterium]
MMLKKSLIRKEKNPYNYTKKNGKRVHVPKHSQRYWKGQQQGEGNFKKLVEESKKESISREKEAPKEEKRQKKVTEKNKEILERLDELESNDKVFSRWATSPENVSLPSFEVYENVIDDSIDEEKLGRALKKAGLLPDEIEAGELYEWEVYASDLLKKAEKGDMNARKEVITAYLWMHDDTIPYDISEREIEGKKQIGLQAHGVNATYHGYTGGAPAGIRYISYLTGDIKGDNLQNDGSVIEIDNIIAIYDNKKQEFVTLDKKTMETLEKE